MRFRRLSLNKIFLSKGQFKHSNNKVLVNLYIFNKEKFNYINILEKVYSSKIKQRTFVPFFIKSLKNIYTKGFFHLKLNQDNYLLKRALSIFEKNNYYHLENFQSLNDYTSHFFKRIISLFLKKYRLFFLYKQLIYINESKLNYTYLRILKKYLEIMFNKNVEFNLINLKRFYLNSDILSETLRLKIAKNRSKMSIFFKKIKNKVKVQRKAFFTGINASKAFKEESVLQNLKYRHITGFRLQAKGRLTRRYTASRSMNKMIYAGNLLNMDSSNRGLSTVLLKGNLKSNIQFTKSQSKTRIGSFGLRN